MCADRCNSVIMDGIAFSYLETANKRTGTGPEYDLITRIETESFKKLYVANFPYLLYPISITGGRITSSYFNARSVGPDGSGGHDNDDGTGTAPYTVTGTGDAAAGFRATDVHIIDMAGPNLTMMALTIDAPNASATRIDKCSQMGTQSSITVIDCYLPSETPFDQSATHPIVSWGNFGSIGVAGTRGAF